MNNVIDFIMKLYNLQEKTKLNMIDFNFLNKKI